MTSPPRFQTDAAMRIAILSDLHGNQEALLQVLDHLAGQQVDEVVCLGDLVGYGPNPEEVVDLACDRAMLALKGNHELALFSPHYYRQLNEATRQSLDITRKLLSKRALAFLTALPRFRVRWGARFVHGCPPTSVTRYLHEPSPSHLAALFRGVREKISFFGHTHVPALHFRDGNKTGSRPMREGVLTMGPGMRYLVNVGSVGQPRDRNDNRAKYVIWDQKAATLELCCVPYNVAATVSKIQALGFPAYNATRLW